MAREVNSYYEREQTDWSNHYERVPATASELTALRDFPEQFQIKRCTPIRSQGWASPNELVILPVNTVITFPLMSSWLLKQGGFKLVKLEEIHGRKPGGRRIIRVDDEYIMNLEVELIPIATYSTRIQEDTDLDRFTLEE
jgi:hypothetical protein